MVTLRTTPKQLALLKKLMVVGFIILFIVALRAAVYRYQVNLGDISVSLQTPMQGLSSALKSNRLATEFVVTWTTAVLSERNESIMIYNRKTGALLCHTDGSSDAGVINENCIYSGVTEDDIAVAANVGTGLNKLGYSCQKLPKTSKLILELKMK
ncbi:MAG: hypothetical protein M3347_14440 [Armatimonadota bacterium]|nr:hypothetical protein [Armatimonadota bacterium]